MVSEPPDSGEGPGSRFSEIVSEGNRRASLEALRDQLAEAINHASSGVVAQLAAQLRATLKELDELPDGKKQTVADDLAAKRKARRDAIASASAAVESQ